MIDEIRLKSGRTPRSDPERLRTAPVTVFVGPNNSGKSKILSEINSFCSSGTLNATNRILDRVIFSNCSREQAEAKCTAFQLPFLEGEMVQPGESVFGRRGGRRHLDRKELVAAIQTPASMMPYFCQCYLSHHVLNLTGQNRTKLISDQPGGDLKADPSTSFQILFQENAKRAECRRIIYDAFGDYLIVDPTLLGQLKLRLSKRAPIDEREERGIHDDAVKFHAAAMPMELASDGVKAFTGIIIEVLAGDPEILLIDEPEAFLHPSLAFSLGKEISSISRKSGKHVFASTHSAAFVMGCIQSGAPVNIVRLTYRDGVATARTLESDDLLKLMRNPLLRSTGVIGGLFYENVIVTESDTDRAFYQEVNERLLQIGKGVPNCLFLNAQNKQTVPTILKPLRNLGIPAAGIVDVDVIKEKGKEFATLLQSLGIPELERTSVTTLRASIQQQLESTGRNYKREGGFNLLSGNDLEAANNFAERLEEYGLFIVRNGELESWLRSLGAPGHGPAWLVDTFEKMGENPENASYLSPSSGDVWDFIGGTRAWLSNPNRKGIPE